VLRPEPRNFTDHLFEEAARAWIAFQPASRDRRRHSLGCFGGSAWMLHLGNRWLGRSHLLRTVGIGFKDCCTLWDRIGYVTRCWRPDNG
jgi:hypothetical protein